MAKRFGEGFTFDSGGYSFIDPFEFARMIEIQNATQHLAQILTALDKSILEHSKDAVTNEVKRLVVAIRSYCKLIPTEVYDQISVLLANCLLPALITDNEAAKKSHFAKVEAWHATKPKFILHLNELREIVFSK